MAWTGSKMFGATIESVFNRSGGVIDADADTFKAALFDNTITPSNTVAAASTAYGAGVWASGGVLDASGWPAVGRNLVTPTSAHTSGTWKFDADDTVSANNTTTLTNAYGALVYDDTAATVADQGLSYNYFGGANSVTSGTFTVVWNTSGIAAIAT